MLSIPRRLVRRARSVAAEVRGGPRRRLARKLVEAGLFDRGWYEEQARRGWPDEASGARHYLGRGRRAGFSPHPLIEPEWIDPSGWRARRRDPVELYLAGGAARGGPHPMFDDAVWLAKATAQARAHPGGPLGHFLATAVDGPLPSSLSAVPITLAELRSALMATVGDVLAQRALAARRTTSTWDYAADAAYVARWCEAPAPAPPDGGPLVSVVMPVRNRPQQVAAAVTSVRAQTLQSWELFVVDDGSDDRTPEVLAELAAQEPRMTVLTQPPSGASRARNAGIDASGGRYVAFLDSDNQWVPHFLRVATAAMSGQDLLAAHAVVEMRSGESVRYLAHQGDRRELEVVNHVDLNTFVVERALLRRVGGFDVTLRRMIDWDLALRVAAVAEPALLPFVGVNYSDSRIDANRISVREPNSWGDVVKAKNLVDWERLTDDLPARDTSAVSVALTVNDAWSNAWSLLDGALHTDRDDDVEVVVVDRGSRMSVARLMAARRLADPRLVLAWLPIDSSPALAWSVGLAASRAARVVLADAVAEARTSGAPPGVPWWRPLADALDDPDIAAAGPVVVGPAATVVHAGLGRQRPGRAPYPMFAAAAPEDVAGGGPMDVVALGDEVLAARAGDLIEARGAYPLFSSGLWGADLSARLARMHGARRRLSVVPSVVLFRSAAPGAPSDVDVACLLERCDSLLPAPPLWDEQAAWRRSGLELVADGPGQRLRRAPGTVPAGPAAGRPALRWTICTAAPFSAHGDRWGDVPFASHLAAALRRLGQHVVVERRGANGRSTAVLDDVFLALRGLAEQPARPGQVNLLWVISHPDLVSSDEVLAYDGVFAASNLWSRTMSERAGVMVRPLLQATDAGRFRPELAQPGTGAAVLFVGSSRGVQRPIVRDAVAAGLDLHVFGTRWDGFLDPRHIKGTYLANEMVGVAYRSAGVLLNDHWPDMAQEGFYSNLLFDAVAAGARVISDPVDGIAELFEGAVLEYRTVGDLARWAGPDRDQVFPDDERLCEISARVRRVHSFDARAAELLDAALVLWDGRRGKAPG